MACMVDIIVIAIAIAALWMLYKASDAACESRDILKRMMKEYDGNNELPKV